MNINVSAQLPARFSNTPRDLTANGSGWDGRPYIGDFPSREIGTGIIEPGPIWIIPDACRPQPSDFHFDLVERMKAAATPLSKFRTTEVGNTHFVALDIPGVCQGDVDLTIDGYVMTVKAQRSDTKEQVIESIVLDKTYDVEPDAIDAWHENGVLTVAFPKVNRGPTKIGVR